MIGPISQRLFAGSPTDTLYHYTSLTGLIGIVDSGHLRASDVRFMNDSTELRHTLELLREHISVRIRSGTDHPALLDEMSQWLSHRMVGGPMLFAASFRANGNLLSQWRGYSVHGKGVSLGFSPGHIAACATNQAFQVGRCIYDEGRQRQLIELIVDAVEAAAAERDPDDAGSAVFELIEEDLLRIAAILKHPAFEEEEEWRVVSPRIIDCSAHPVSFREGNSMLVPYYRFDLALDRTRGIALDHVFVGPTANADLSTTSIELFLDARGSRPERGIDYCRIPYRQR